MLNCAVWFFFFFESEEQRQWCINHQLSRSAGISGAAGGDLFAISQMNCLLRINMIHICPWGMMLWCQRRCPISLWWTLTYCRSMNVGYTTLGTFKLNPEERNCSEVKTRMWFTGWTQNCKPVWFFSDYYTVGCFLTQNHFWVQQ